MSSRMNKVIIVLICLKFSFHALQMQALHIQGPEYESPDR